MSTPDDIDSTRDRETTPRGRDTASNRNPGERSKWVSALVALLGLWMILQALWFDLAAGQFWNDVVVGALLLAAGGYNYTRRTAERVGNMAAAGLVALLGLWLIVAPFIFGPGLDAGPAVGVLVFWNDFTVGLIVLLLGAYSAYVARDRRRATGRTTAR